MTSTSAGKRTQQLAATKLSSQRVRIHTRGAGHSYPAKVAYSLGAQRSTIAKKITRSLVVKIQHECTLTRMAGRAVQAVGWMKVAQQFVELAFRSVSHHRNRRSFDEYFAPVGTPLREQASHDIVPVHTNVIVVHGGFVHGKFSSKRQKMVQEKSEIILFSLSEGSGVFSVKKFHWTSDLSRRLSCVWPRGFPTRRGAWRLRQRVPWRFGPGSCASPFLPRRVEQS